jgi:hypothetical protein
MRNLTCYNHYFLVAKNFKFGSSWAYTTIFREILKTPGNEKLSDQFIVQHFWYYSFQIKLKYLR